MFAGSSARHCGPLPPPRWPRPAALEVEEGGMVAGVAPALPQEPANPASPDDPSGLYLFVHGCRAVGHHAAALVRQFPWSEP